MGTGCTPAPEQSSTNSTATGDNQPVTMGFIYVGSKDDYGYNQAHAEGKEGGITTDVCVHTIMREANDRGYECLLLFTASWTVSINL